MPITATAAMVGANVRVTFSQAILINSFISNPHSYFITGGPEPIIVLSILPLIGLSTSTVDLVTTELKTGVTYTLTIPDLDTAPPVLYADDTFHRANTADVTGSITEIGAKVWTSGAGRPIGIVSNEMNFPADGSGIGVAWIDAGHADHRSALSPGSILSPQGPDLLVRIPDPTIGPFHCLLIRFYDGGVIQLYDVTWTANFASATAGTLLFNSSNTSMPNAGSLCEVLSVGDQIQMIKNGVSWGTFTSSLNQTATRTGVNIGLGNHCTISEYKVSPP